MVGFITENGVLYAGKHLLIDLYDCKNNSDMDTIERTMVSACKAIGATVLFHYAHPFTGGGSSGAVILAESHLTWHLWFEEKYVSIDIFVCGTCDPNNAVHIIENLFQPARMNIKMEKRGTEIIDKNLCNSSIAA